MADEGAIPLVDFSVMGLNCANPPSQDDESVKLLAEKIHTAFSTIGFVYLSNHGISASEASLGVHGGITYKSGLFFMKSKSRTLSFCFFFVANHYAKKREIAFTINGDKGHTRPGLHSQKRENLLTFSFFDFFAFFLTSPLRFNRFLHQG